MNLRPWGRREKTLRTAVRLLLGLGVSALCLYLATRGVAWGEVGTVLRNASWGWVLMVVLISLASHAVRAQRWRVLLRPVTDAPYYPALSATLIGFGASMVLPLRLGEIIRPAVFARRVGIPLSPAFSSVVLERLIDTMFVVICFVLVVLAYPDLAEYRQLAWGAAFAVVAAMGGLFLVARFRGRAESLASAVLGLLPGRVERVLAPVVRGLLDGVGGLGDMTTVAAVLAYSTGLWGCVVLTYLFSFLALDIAVPLVSASLATVVIVAAFVFLPQGPGFVGTWQAGCVLALALFAVPHEEAVGYAFLTWLIQMFVNIGAGGLCAAFEDVSLRQIMSSGEQRA